MRSGVLSMHPGLAHDSRISALAYERHSARLVALGALVAAGACAAVATTYLDFGLRIPGHAILRAVFPMAFGLALAPCRMGGLVMGAAAVGTALMLHLGGSVAVGVGALTSLAVTGPFLDATLWRVRGGWRLYLGFALAGLASNVTALTIRTAAKFGGLDQITARPFATWWLQAVGTYALCGILAGLLSAIVWFRFSSGGSRAVTAASGSELSV